MHVLVLVGHPLECEHQYQDDTLQHSLVNELVDPTSRTKVSYFRKTPDEIPISTENLILLQRFKGLNP